MKPYWTQTSANTLIKNEINKKDAQEIRDDILNLLNNKPITKYIEENFVFPDFQTDKDLLWSLLLFSGYLTISKEIRFDRFELTIPNYELRYVFTKTVLDWLNVDVKVKKNLLVETTNHLINNELDKFERGFKKIMGDTFSYYDTQKVNEYVFHAYLLGLLAVIGDDYIIKYNRESGEGRYDILLIPHVETLDRASQHGVVIEIKQTEKQKQTENETTFNERINKILKDAMQQIEINKYYKELIDYGIEESKIIKLPIVFAGKEPYIGIC